MPTDDGKVKKITVRKLPKKTSYVIHYADGRKTETTYVEIQGTATLYLDHTTKEPTIRTEANVSLGQAVGTCVVCGGDTDDQHAHA
jgi:hypothetical protein